MIKILLFIKHRLGFLWNVIEFLNGFLFGMIYRQRVKSTLSSLLRNANQADYIYREMEETDLANLQQFFKNQDPEQFRYFKPHGFDQATLKRLHSNPAFTMMGVFKGDEIVGYFFLRFFVNKKCFIGRIVDGNHQRKGIARSMNEIMYQAVWRNGFRCLSTISKHNDSIYNFHLKEKNMVLLKELPDDYLFVEIRKPD